MGIWLIYSDSMSERNNDSRFTPSHKTKYVESACRYSAKFCPSIPFPFPIVYAGYIRFRTIDKRDNARIPLFPPKTALITRNYDTYAFLNDCTAVTVRH